LTLSDALLSLCTVKCALFVTYSYPPSRVPSAQRPFAFAKYLARRGWQIHVLTPRHADSALGFDDNPAPLDGVQIHHTRNFEPFKLLREKPGSEAPAARLDGLWRACLTGRLKALAKRFVRQNIFHPDRARFWHRHAMREGRRVVARHRPAIILGTAPMFTNLWVARDLARESGIPWVADFRDLFAVMPHPTSKPNRFDKELERTAIEEAAAVLFISESFRSLYSDAFPSQRHKMSVIYNGYDPEEFAGAEPPPRQAPLTIFYAGSLYGGRRDPLPLWRALAWLKRERGVTPADCVVEIAGPTDGVRLGEISRLGIQGFVRTLGLLARTDALRRMRRAHLLWLIVGDTAHHTAGVPLKLYEYMAAQRPVLAFVPPDTECADIIRRTRMGVVLSSQLSQTPQVAAVLEEFLAKHKAGQTFGVELTAESQKFRRPEQAAQLERIFLDVLGRRAASGSSPRPAVAA
jgi:glycosyltransferase involved in cell wall biosynthesis